MPLRPCYGKRLGTGVLIPWRQSEAFSASYAKELMVLSDQGYKVVAQPPVTAKACYRRTRATRCGCLSAKEGSLPHHCPYRLLQLWHARVDAYLELPLAAIGELCNESFCVNSEPRASRHP